MSFLSLAVSIPPDIKYSLSLFFALVFNVLCHALDFEDPMITSISVTPSVDVTSEDEMIKKSGLNQREFHRFEVIT